MSKNTRRRQEEESNLIEKVIYINRVAKVVKGGRRFSFSAIVVVGDGQGSVGLGFGKANEVPEAIRKGTERAKAAMQTIALVDGTISHEVVGHYGAGRVLLKPAAAGTGVIAGPGVRAIMEAAGVHNVLTKSLGSSNPHNMVHAAMDALEQLESAEDVAARLGKDIADVQRNYTVRSVTASA